VTNPIVFTLLAVCLFSWETKPIFFFSLQLLPVFDGFSCRIAQRIRCRIHSLLGAIYRSSDLGEVSIGPLFFSSFFFSFSLERLKFRSFRIPGILTDFVLFHFPLQSVSNLIFSFVFSRMSRWKLEFFLSLCCFHTPLLVF